MKINLPVVVFIAASIVAGCRNNSDSNGSSGATVATNNVNNAASVAPNNLNVTTDATNTQKAALNSAPTSLPKENFNVTAANFSKIKTGMSYDEVVKILGTEGKVLSEDDSAGTKITMYQWYGAGFNMIASLKIVFQNDKVIDKANTGVR